MLRIKFTAIILICAVTFIHAQSSVDSTKKHIRHSLSEVLPPLIVILDSATINSPLIKMYEQDILLKQGKFISTKRYIGKYVGVEASLVYGMFSNLVANEFSNPNLNSGVLSSSTQTRYSVGMSLRIPFYDVWDRRNLINQSKIEIDKSKYEREKYISELRQKLIELYSKLSLSYTLMYLKSENVESSEIQLIKGEKDFIAGSKNTSELAATREMYMKSITDFETTRNEFNNYFLLMQEISGMRFKLNSGF